MEKLIKNKDIILDGTLPRYAKEEQAFSKLEEIEKVLDKYSINSLKELDEKLDKSSNKVNLAKALTKNKNCLGYILQFNNGKCHYQNDNDLGIDLDALDNTIHYKEKIYLYKNYYAYFIVEDVEDDNTGIDLELAKALLKECHKHFIPLTSEEKVLCANYWKQF